MMASKIQTFEIPQLVTKHVTVYADRAEVKRLVLAKLHQGSNEVIIKKLSRSIDSDSIRVEGRGKSVISEVKYQEKHVKKEEEIKNTEKELNDKLTKLRDGRSKIEQENQRLKKQRDVLEGVATQIGSSSSPDNDDKKKVSGLALITDVSLDNLEKFLSYYAKRVADIDNELNSVQKQFEKVDEEIAVIERNLGEIYNNDSFLSREISIILEADEAGAAELDVSYVVWNASWAPSYDLRVATDDKTMKVAYYGLIKQSTNEDWNEASLSLSTAMPRVGGQVPELATLKVGFRPPPPPVQPVAYYAQHDTAPRMMKMKMAAPMMARMSNSFLGGGGRSQESAEMEVAVTNVVNSVISTSYEIAHPTSIPSDNTSHKVTVAIVDLKPTFEYETVPSKSPYAYLKAKVTNTSNYPFLAGPTSIFLDNNFVAKSCMKSVSPSEEFSCSLGVDPAVRVEYKPARKFHEESGILSKSSILTHEQKIEIKNTKPDTIKIIVHEHLPLSGEEKLKVNIVEPNANKNEKGVTFKVNKHNNVEWEVFVPKNETREVVLKYNLEHPKGEQLEYKEE